MFVVRMCFLALLAAPLLQEESGALHHEEALAQAANTWDTKGLEDEMRQDEMSRNGWRLPQVCSSHESSFTLLFSAALSS